jgi:hypothetical protein
MASINAEMQNSKIALCLYGRFNNRLAQNSGARGFEYIRESLLSKYDVDVFIYSSDLENAQQVSELYQPWAKEMVFESQQNFASVLEQNQINESSFDAKQGFYMLGARQLNWPQSIKAKAAHSTARWLRRDSISGNWIK